MKCSHTGKQSNIKAKVIIKSSLAHAVFINFMCVLFFLFFFFFFFFFFYKNILEQEFWEVVNLLDGLRKLRKWYF